MILLKNSSAKLEFFLPWRIQVPILVGILLK